MLNSIAEFLAGSSRVIAGFWWYATHNQAYMIEHYMGFFAAVMMFGILIAAGIQKYRALAKAAKERAEEEAEGSPKSKSKFKSKSPKTKARSEELDLAGSIVDSNSTLDPHHDHTLSLVDDSLISGKTHHIDEDHIDDLHQEDSVSHDEVSSSFANDMPDLSFQASEYVDRVA